MMYSEFTKLAGFKVTESYYHEVIEPEYMNCSLEKDAFVKTWKKNGGVQKAYDAMVSRYEDKAGFVEHLKEMSNNQRIALSETREENFKLRCEIDEIKEKLTNRETEYNNINDAYNQAMWEKKDLAYFMLEQSERSANSELRAKVIEMIGFKAYIEYKFEHDMNIWQLDRYEIMKHL